MFCNKDFINFIEKSRKSSKDIVLVNILDTKGFSYSKSCTSMMIDNLGDFEGSINGGVFEEEIISLSKEILEDKKGKYVVYNYEIKDELAENLNKEDLLQGEIRLWCEPFYFRDNYGSLAIALNNALNDINNTLIRSTKNSGAHSFSPTFDKRDCFYNEEEKLFYQKIVSPYRLLVFGTQIESEALVQMANILGWQTFVCDVNDTKLKKIKSADERIFLKSNEQAFEVLNSKKFDAAVVMSHNFANDAMYLKALIESKVEYIGVLGTKERTQLILKSLYKRTTPIDSRIHNPAGLDIGAQTPQAIALSICAQIESLKNK
jgi:xanthine dehydrogenase accessory factor